MIEIGEVSAIRSELPKSDLDEVVKKFDAKIADLESRIDMILAYVQREVDPY